jgi:excinuclease ABC subunit C
MASKNIEAQLRHLPDNPGVYRFYDKEDIIIYIGKAKNLKKRVNSYFQNIDQHTAKTKLLVAKIYKVEYTIVPREHDALLLENALIKEHQPRYNINLKDDKTYPYLKITAERFPKIEFTRKYVDDGSEYFGPYTSIHRARILMELIRKIYTLRNCSLTLSAKNISLQKFKPCLEYHIGNCSAPCIGNESESDYLIKIEEIRDILNGKLSQLKDYLEADIKEYVSELAFEKAELAKQKLIALQDYIQHSTVVNPGMGNFHVFGYEEEDTKAFIHYFYVYQGTIIRTKNYTVTKALDEEKSYILSYVILDMIGNDVFTPIIAPFEPLELENYPIHIPKITEKKKLLDLAQKNAKQSLLNFQDKPTGKYLEVLEQAKKDLRLQDIPYHIECFDNSNFQGDSAVSACVVFRNGKPSKKDYRHYNVKTVQGPDDFATMREVVYRRYKRMLDEQATLPQLIIIDGGKGQLSSAVEVLRELEIYGKVQIISIAKKLEEIYYPEDKFPLHISKKSYTLKLIQQLRDEAHRFGISFHRKKRDKKTLRTSLTDIEGIGEVLSARLLKHFGSVQSIKQAEEGQLAEIVGAKKAHMIKLALK